MPEPNKIREVAELAAATQLRLREDLKAATDPAEREKLRQRIRSCRTIERFCRTRRGYA